MNTDENAKKSYVLVGYKSIIKDAEKTAADIIAKANAKSDSIIAEAKSESEKLLESAKVTLEEERKPLQEYKRAIDNYNDKSQKYWSELSQLFDSCKNELDRKTSKDLCNFPKLDDYIPIRKPYDPETATAPPTNNDIPEYLSSVDRFRWMKNNWDYYNSAQERKKEADKKQKPN